MANYEELMGLVEEVRDLMNNIVEAKQPPHMAKFKKPTLHNPFRHVKKGKALGPGPRGGGPLGKKAGYWRCRCINYTCACKGSEGEKKTVKIDDGYKFTYNIAYRKWRKNHPGQYKPGKVFKVRKPKAGTM